MLREKSRESPMSTSDLEGMAERLRRFADERDWHQFHTPKNLVMALAGEVGELTEVFQWLTPDESAEVMRDPAKAEAVRDELADVLYYLVRAADVLGVNLADALSDKLEKNAQRYPIEASRGSASKYTELSKE
jgi:NTP pyrophosphatase (non-canonical NTP hydrolase)